MNHLVRSKIALRLAVTFCIVLLISQGLAWGPAGHMIVAQIAYGRLNSRAKAEVDKLIAMNIPPSEITQQSQDFVNAAHWPDDLRPVKDFAWSLQEHFIDTPFSGDGTELPDPPDGDNIITALKQNVETLKSDSDDNKRAQALRFIIHFVGDVHQPLHCATRVTEENPEGDRGGNLFIVRVGGNGGRIQKVKLHSYWDGGIGTFPKPGPNFAPPSLDTIGPVADRVTTEFPDTDTAWKEGGAFNFQGWADESNELAQKVAYQGLGPRGQSTAAYQKKAIRTVDKRVAWAGYRLAELLNNIWPEQ